MKGLFDRPTFGGMTVSMPQALCDVEYINFAGLPDCMIVAWIATVGMCALLLTMVRNGAGIDESRIPDDQIKKFSMVMLPLSQVADLLLSMSSKMG